MTLHRYNRTDRSGLYRIYNAADHFIYVGISYEPHARVDQHRTRQTWGAEIARYTVEWFDDRTSCEAAEAQIIQDEKPPHNRHPGNIGAHDHSVVDGQDSPWLAAVAEAYNLIGQREREYRAVLRRKLDSGEVRQVDVAKALGRTREMIRRDSMSDERRDALRGVTAGRPQN